MPIKNAVCFVSRRNTRAHPSERSPSKNRTFQLVIIKIDGPVYNTYVEKSNAEKSNVFSAVSCCHASSWLFWLL